MCSLPVLLALSRALMVALQVARSCTMASRRIARKRGKFRWNCWPRSHALTAAPQVTTSGTMEVAEMRARNAEPAGTAGPAL